MRFKLPFAASRADEAALWYARLNADVVTHAELRAFRRWRRRPGADAAYTQVEVAWRRVAPLAADPGVRAMAAPPPRGFGIAADPSSRGLGSGLAWATAAGAALLLVMAGGVAVWRLRPPTTVATSGLRPRTLRLADGSQLMLDAGTELHVRLSASVRRVELDRGRVLVDVAHDPRRPFSVQAGDAQVVARGTRFVVAREGDEAQVVLLRGVVDVRTRRDRLRPWRLSPGETLDTRLPLAERADPTADLGWTEGRVVLDRTPPAEAVGQVNRYLRRPVRLDPDLAGSAPISGVFAAGDRDAFVTALHQLRGWRATEQTDGSIRLSAASGGDVTGGSAAARAGR